MKLLRIFRFVATVLTTAALLFPRHGIAESIQSADDLLQLATQYLGQSPEKALPILDRLQVQQTTLTKNQAEKYFLLQASSLGFQGKHRERISLILSCIDNVSDPAIRVKFLYELSDAYAIQGEYENAFRALNQSIVLLPQLNEFKAKIYTLGSAISSFISLQAYDEALTYAERLYALAPNGSDMAVQCIGMANLVEINFLRGERQLARKMQPEALKVCDKNGFAHISLLLKSLSVVDQIDFDDPKKGIETGLPLITEFSKNNQNSDYLTQLEDAIARAYLKINDLKLAEQYGLQAYQRAKFGNLVQLMEKSSETMAAIKRKQGQAESAMDYFEINLALKKKVLNDQLQKNLAYQRVKFDTQDKTNQLALSEQKNRTLTIEKALQQGKNQNLLLMITLSLILLTIVGAWLIRTLRQKNIFRVSSQIDGLTQISSRAYFIESAKLALKNPANNVTLILFDMDHFKSINDTFGHSTGDWVLRTVCNVVKSQLRPTDLLGRLGGEEFAICLTNLSEQGVLALAERCRAGVASIDTKPSGSQFLISASFGIASHGVRGNISFDDILAAADKALYFSKNGGRNMVSVFQ